MPHNSRRAAGIAAAAIVSALLVSGCSLQPDVSAHVQSPDRTDQPAPPLTGTSLTGARIDLAQFRGAPLVLDFWASWCGPCRQEQSELNALVSRYATRGVRFLGVDIRDDSANALAFVQQNAVTYSSVFDPSSDAAGAFGVDSPPTTLVIDAAGRIRLRELGELNDVSSTLDSLLARS